MKPGGFRREAVTVDVGAPNDRLQGAKTFILKAEPVNECIEAASLAGMRKVCAWNIESDSRPVASDIEDFAGGNVDDLGAGIEKSPNEPGTCKAVDFGSLARHPARRPPLRKIATQDGIGACW